MSELLVNLVRGSLIESQHRGDLVVADREGAILLSLGNPEHLAYWRSSAKPFQALPLIEHHCQDIFNFTEQEIALFTSSHGGEENHVEAIRGILHKLGLSDSALDCGVSAPMHRPSAKNILASGNNFSTLNNACSGKHTGMLALALLLNAPLTGYIQKDHPVQQEMLKAICQCTSLSPDRVHMGVDGCGVPVFGLPLGNMAMAYARLSLPEGYFSAERVQALHTIRNAMTEYPYYVAGTDRLDSILMEVTQGRIVAKIGSEGIYCAGIVDHGIGLALKIEDGSSRAIDPVIIEVLKHLGYISQAEFEKLRHLWRPILKNHRGDEIGHLEVAFNFKNK
ncbi:asparaginase [Desulforamulus reducens MI-1]|uniref:Asparaginase n=1 Tax=Desulforamulus reducens (strain ATCC BAA-1160 / DSM 100696 / MI-1) TaxID=349161 RepID=A4J467_DESRM|nr:asparaginase [Desulforamulus reducens]ABO49870.1 asparaginase [Desulforamulus reducens MI-1]